MNEDGRRGGADKKFYVIDGAFESLLAAGSLDEALRQYIWDEELKNICDLQLMFWNVFAKEQNLK